MATANGDNWVGDLALKRRCQNSNVYIVETLDPKRIDELRSRLSAGGLDKLVFGEKSGDGFTSKWDYDLQSMGGRPVIWDVSHEEPRSVTTDPGAALQSLDEKLRGESTFAMMRYVVQQAHADQLTEHIVGWSQDTDLYEKQSTIVIFTANANYFSEPIRRLCYVLSPVPSTPAERDAKLKSVAKQLTETLTKAKQPIPQLEVNSTIINASAGLTLHDTETAAFESFQLTRKFTVDVFTRYKMGILKTYGIEYVEPRRGFESVGGFSSLKTYLTRSVIRVLKEPAIAAKYGLKVPRGILLFGPPGTGKSWIAYSLSKEIGLPMLKLSPADFLRGIVGETESRIKQLLTIIDSMGHCVVFVDEFDQIALSRQGQFIGDSGVSRRMQNMLLDWMGNEHRQAFMVGATNFIDLDPAFVRPGRIDEIVPVFYPDQEARKEILRIHTGLVRTMPVDKDVDFNAISEKTRLWSGAELEKLAVLAARNAMDQDTPTVTMTHFTAALEGFNVDTGKRASDLKNTVEKMKAMENVNQVFLRDEAKEFLPKLSEKGRAEGFVPPIGTQHSNA